MKRLLHGFSQIARVLDQEIVFDNRPCNADRIALLERVQTNRVRWYLPRDDHHGNTVHIGGSNAGHSIRGTRPGGYQRDAHITRGTGVAVCGMNGTLFVANQNVLNGVLLVESVVNVKYSPTWIAPDVFNAFGLQSFNENLGASELLHRSG